MQNTCKHLLKSTIPLKVQQRVLTDRKMAEVDENELANFEAKISIETPLKDFQKLIKERVEMNEIVPDEVLQANFKKISAAGRDAAWKLLFSENPVTQEKQVLAADLLRQLKSDSCFHSPWEYNEWIATVRDEVLKRKMIDFWREYMVAQELGPCWARDSDYFDDLDDPEPEEFYKYAGCVAVFSEEAGHDVDSNFVAEISLENPLRDYKKLMKERVEIDVIIADEVLQENFKKIANGARETVWKLLFDEQPATQERQTKAGDLLREHKCDACFHSPWEYNEWVVTLREELLKRKMLDFWRDQVVKRELGPCWARDSDYFEDMEDTEAESFYNRAGCVAVFSKDAKKDTTDKPASSSGSAAASQVPAKISNETPVENYKAMIQHQTDSDADNHEKFKAIFTEAQQVIWNLLFTNGETLTKENSEKAAALLVAYKSDACFFNPHIYNEWIPKLRDELFKRKYMDFWKQIIVDKQLGLCWYKDSDYFDDSEDTRPIEFYKSGDDLMK